MGSHKQAVRCLMPNELRQFFKSYQLGFDSFDADAIAAHYNIPASIYDGDGLHVYSSRKELAAKFGSNSETFKGMGYSGAQFSVGYYHKTGDIGAVVDLGWRVRLGMSNRDFRATYICVLNDQQWHIFSAVAYEGPYHENDT